MKMDTPLRCRCDHRDGASGASTWRRLRRGDARDLSG